ncbi:unnamed protein product [Rhizophagus irregularis]|nr:unnamed protein product [Rhizophagus irregularis]
MTTVSKNLISGFEGTYEEHVEYIALPHLVDGQTYSPKCGMAICYSCNQLVYLGIESLSIGERYVYNCSEGKFKTEKFRYISFNGEHWGMYQHWATACTGNKFRKLNFKEYMEIKQLIPLDKWMSFHQIIQFEGIPSDREQWPKDATNLSSTD